MQTLSTLPILITTEPIINFNHSSNLLDRWNSYSITNKFLDIVSFPLSSIEYNTKNNGVNNYQLKNYYNAIFFISPNAIHSYYQNYENILNTKNIWLIGKSSYDIFCKYYNENYFNITYIKEKNQANAQNLFYLLKENNQFYINQHILVVKGNIENNWFYNKLQEMYNTKIDYSILYTKKYLNYSDMQLELLHNIFSKQSHIHVYISSSDILYVWQKYTLNYKYLPQTIYTKHIKIKQKAEHIYTDNTTKVVLIEDLL